jgi:Na+/H+ antiporter NhaB
MKLGDQWNKSPAMKAAFHSADAVIALVLMVAVGFYVWHKLHGLKRR